MTTALVTGALGGIGRAICDALFNEDHSVIGIDLPKTPDNDFHYSYLSMDITDYAACAPLADLKADVLVNCAGVTADSSFRRMTSDKWDHVIKVCLYGPYNVTHHVWPSMIDRGYGRIVNIASVNAFLLPFGQANYAAAKAAVVALTKVLAKEGARYNVHVNAVAPGYVDTPMVRKIAPDVLEKIIATIPLGRLLRPQEIGKTVAHLVSEDAEPVNGEVFHINGGLYEIDHAIYAEE